jgi:hypothetical protein
MNNNELPEINAIKKDTKKDFIEKSLGLISEAIDNFPKRSALCFEKSGNSRLGCAQDLLLVIVTNFLIIEKMEIDMKNFELNNYGELVKYKTEALAISAHMNKIRLQKIKLKDEKENEDEFKKAHEKAQAALDDLDRLMREIKRTIEEIKNAKVAKGN